MTFEFSSEGFVMPVQILSTKMEHIVPKDLAVERLGKGFGGSNGPAEGPVWWNEEGCLLFSDIHNDRIVRWAPHDGVRSFLSPCNRTNGLTRDPQGRLVACEHDTRRVTRLEPDGSITVIANSYKSRQLNRPNDVVVKSDGSIYFTDPFGRPAWWPAKYQGPQEEWEMDIAGVFRVSPDLGTTTLLALDFVRPNGLAFSPDESVLYINDSRRNHIRAFELMASGAVARATGDRIFCDLRGDEPGGPNGMKVDVEGNIYCGGSGGIWVIDPSGKHLGTIITGEPLTTNMAWGGDDWKTLYITSLTTLFRIHLNIPGVPVPPSRADGATAAPRRT